MTRKPVRGGPSPQQAGTDETETGVRRTVTAAGRNGGLGSWCAKDGNRSGLERKTWKLVREDRFTAAGLNE